MSDELKQLENDPDGMAIYEYIVNHVADVSPHLSRLIEKMREVDLTGQFLASSARFLAAVDRPSFEPFLTPLIEGALERDRERKYIGSLLEAIWGPDYKENAEELLGKDHNFRRIYKRIYARDV